MSLLAVTSGDIASGVVEAEGVDFDGVNDYLSRSTDLVGNVDSKTFTFSAWVYTNPVANKKIYDVDNGYFQVYVSLVNGIYSLRVTGYSSSLVLALRIDNIPLPANTYFHIVMSIDLVNIANRKVFVNDIDVSSSITYTTFANVAIGFAKENHRIAASSYLGAADLLKGRLSNIFLDYTYRDLSIEANRRLFITADGKPA